MWPRQRAPARLRIPAGARRPRSARAPAPVRPGRSCPRRTAGRSASRRAARAAAGRTWAADSPDRAPSRCAPRTTSTKPARSVSDGCPVKLLMVSISSRSDGTSSRSTSEKMRAISPATLRRNRSACTKSTAERKRAWRNRLGQASGTCTLSWSTPWLERELLERRGGFGEEDQAERAVRPVGQRSPRPAACPASSTVSSAARSTSVAGSPSSSRESSRRAARSTGAAASKSRWLGTLATSPGRGRRWPAARASRPRRRGSSGPSLSSDQQSVIAPVRGTRPIGGPQAGDAAAHRRRDDAAAGLAADREADQPRRGGRARARRSSPTRPPRAATDSSSGRRTRCR